MSNIKYDDTDYLINREESIEYKISDTNVASIEEDIKRCEQLIKPEHASWIGISNQLAIAGALARIQELEDMLKEKDKEIEKKDKRINDLEYALLDMVMQFADRPNIKGSNYALNTMGLSALELAFDVLGFDDPYPVKRAEEKYKNLTKQYFERKSEEC